MLENSFIEVLSSFVLASSLHKRVFFFFLFRPTSIQVVVILFLLLLFFLFIYILVNIQCSLGFGSRTQWCTCYIRHPGLIPKVPSLMSVTPPPPATLSLSFFFIVDNRQVVNHWLAVCWLRSNVECLSHVDWPLLPFASFCLSSLPVGVVFPTVPQVIHLLVCSAPVAHLLFPTCCNPFAWAIPVSSSLGAATTKYRGLGVASTTNGRFSQFWGWEFREIWYLARTLSGLRKVAFSLCPHLTERGGLVSFSS